MKISMNKLILGLDGNPLADENGASVKLRTVVQGALLASLPEDRGMAGPEKAKMFKLALEANNSTVDWTVEDIAIVKARVGITSTPLAVGRAYEILDPPAAPFAPGEVVEVTLDDMRV